MEVLVVALALVVVWMVMLTVAVGAGFWALSRHNRVSSQHATGAPLSWVISPASAARLHRRLRTAVGWVEHAADPTEPTTADDLQRRLVGEAVAVDAHLVRAAGAPRAHRKPLLRQARVQVSEVERLAVRVHRLQRPPTVPPTGRPAPAPDVAANLADLRQHLDLLDAAHAELEDLERHAGLGEAPDLPDPAPHRRPVAVDGEILEAEVVERPAARPPRTAPAETRPQPGRPQAAAGG